MTHTTGLILAGGAGSRLGGICKAELRIGGRRLLLSVEQCFAGYVDELLVAAGQEAGLSVPGGARLILDAPDQPTGPLAGFRAAMRFLENQGEEDDILIAAAVDTPFLPADFVPRLAAEARLSGAAFATWGENFYPTNCAWRIDRLRAALARADENAGPRALLGAVSASPVDWGKTIDSDPFANINTLADLIALQARAREPGSRTGSGRL